MLARHVFVLAMLTGTVGGAHAINANYARQLERSGCTQVSEMQGCDIDKSKAENAKAGFGASAPVSATPAASAASTKTNGIAQRSSYVGWWTAKTASGDTVARIRVDAKERVEINGKRVKARRADGALVFRQGQVTYTIQGDRRIQGEDTWFDHDAGTRGQILAE